MCVELPSKRAGVRVNGPSLDHPVMRGIEVVAHTNMEGRADGLQMQYLERNGEHYLYVGHFWSGGVSVLDVTDPGKPVVVGFIKGSNPSTWNIKVQIADGILMLPNELNIFTAVPVDPKGLISGVRLFDLADPVNPEEVSFIPAGGIGVHRSWWNGGDYAHFSAGMKAPGVFMHGDPDTTRVVLTADVSDPRNPRVVSEFWLPEQRGETQIPVGQTIYVHEPIVEGDRGYIAYWDGGFVILDMDDMSNPKMISHTRTFPEWSDGNTHTCLPLSDRGLLLVGEENTASYGADGGAKDIWLFDIKDEEHPRPVAKFPKPIPSSEEPWESYLERGDRFGPHCVHENYQGTFQSQTKVYSTWCNAGLRIYDISNEADPKEIAYFVPPDPEIIVDPRPYDRLFDIFHGGSRVACTQDVLVDPRGYIYITGTNDGVWILKETA